MLLLTCSTLKEYVSAATSIIASTVLLLTFALTVPLAFQ